MTLLARAVARVQPSTFCEKNDCHFVDPSSDPRAAARNDELARAQAYNDRRSVASARARTARAQNDERDVIVNGSI